MKAKFKILIAMIAVLLVTTLSTVFSFAQPPRRAILYGVTYGSGQSATTHAAKIIPVNNMTFGIYSDDTLELCTRLYLYFRADSEIVTSFHLSLKLLSTQFQYGTQNNAFIQLLNISDAGSVSDAVNVRDYSTVAVDGDVINFDFRNTAGNSLLGRSAIQVVIIFQNFMIGQSPMYFEMLDFTVNDMSMEDLAIAEQTERFQRTLERFSTIENQLTTNIPVEDIRNYLQSTDGDNYFQSFQYLIGSSSLLSSMIAIVALLGIVSFIIFGKKVSG